MYTLRKSSLFTDGLAFILSKERCSTSFGIASSETSLPKNLATLRMKHAYYDPYSLYNYAFTSL